MTASNALLYFLVSPRSGRGGGGGGNGNGDQRSCESFAGPSTDHYDNTKHVLHWARPIGRLFGKVYATACTKGLPCTILLSKDRKYRSIVPSSVLGNL